VREEPDRIVYVSQITKHYSKPGVTPVEVLPVFPDFKVGAAPDRSFFPLAFSRPRFVSGFTSVLTCMVPTKLWLGMMCVGGVFYSWRVLRLSLWIFIPEHIIGCL